MREYIISSLILFCLSAAQAQTVPAGWQIIKDAKNACQIAVPPDWSPYGESQSAAVFHDSSVALAIVTSQPGQDFHTLSDGLLRVMGISKDQLFENSATRTFYQDRKSEGKDDPNGYSVGVPGKGGTCSAHLTFLPSITVDTAKKIALSLGPFTPPRSN